MTTVGVIGAGPAGSIAAITLLGAGFDVKVFDHIQHKTGKPCGGGLTYKTIKLLKHLNIKIPDSSLPPYAEPIHNFQIVCPIDGHCYVTGMHSDNDVLSLVNRYDFDGWLRSQLPPTIDARVSGLKMNGSPSDSLKIITNKDSYDVDYLIAADGVNSSFGKAAHGSFKNDETIVACETIVPNERGTFAHVIQNPTRDPLNAGYSWVFAKDKTANVGTGVMRSYDKYYVYYKNYITKIAREYYRYTVNGFEKNWIIPLFGERNMYIPETKYKGIVVGDALGTADVFFAEGIYGGMYNAYTAAKWLKHYDDWNGYDDYWYNSQYAKNMKALAFLQYQANGNYVKAFNLLKQAGVFAGFLDFIRGEITPKKFLQFVNRNYTFKSISLYLEAVIRKGKEKEVLYYDGWPSAAV